MQQTHQRPIIEDPRSSKEARAKRLESLRGLTRLSRVEFAKKCGVRPGSFQNWEGPRFGGLTEKAAKKIIRGVKAFGIQCNLEWLMHGIGPGPQIDERLYLSDTLLNVREPHTPYITSDDETQHIAEELLLFRQHYPDSMEYVVSDDGMEPFYKTGEYIAGKSYYHQEIGITIGQDCIIKTLDGEILFRNIKKGSVADRYTLVCTNPHATVSKPTLYDMELLSAAPVLWVRRRTSIKS